MNIHRVLSRNFWCFSSQIHEIFKAVTTFNECLSLCVILWRCEPIVIEMTQLNCSNLLRSVRKRFKLFLLCDLIFETFLLIASLSTLSNTRFYIQGKKILAKTSKYKSNILDNKYHFHNFQSMFWNWYFFYFPNSLL